MTSDMRQRVEDLERRLAAVEAALPRNKEGSTGEPIVAEAAEGASDPFWALNGLNARIEQPGAVMIVGGVTLPDGRSARWQEGAGLADLMDPDWEDLSSTLGALAHPVRLRILRTILHDGPRSAKELAALEGMGTTGQIYHHLRLLSGAGWARAGAQNHYEIPAERIIPLLTTVLGGRR